MMTKVFVLFANSKSKLSHKQKTAKLLRLQWVYCTEVFVWNHPAPWVLQPKPLQLAWCKIWTGLFLDHFIGGMYTISTQGGVGCSLSVLREGWEAECYYSGRGERRSVITQWGMRDGLLLHMKGWEVVVIVNTFGSRVTDAEIFTFFVWIQSS